MAKKTKAQIQEKLDTLGAQYLIMIDQFNDVTEECARKREYIAHLETRNIELTDRAESDKAKMFLFKQLLQDEKKATYVLEVKLEDRYQNNLSLQEDIVDQFSAIQTVIENAEAMLLDK